MEKKNFYSVSALFHTADDIIHAAEAVRDAGYTQFDVNTPYPVHGMDDAMGLKPSKLGFITLFAGFSGALGLFLFVVWVTAIDYPNVIGGKPFFSWPAFVPVTFEATVLTAVLTTIGALIVFFFKFPNNSHPMHDTAYMKAVSSDKFGLYIKSSDPLFDEKKVKELLKSLHGDNITFVQYDEEEISYAPSIFEPKFLLLLVVVALLTSGGTYFTLNKLMYMTPFDWMMNQNKFKPQATTTQFADGRAMRPLVEGTVAHGFLPYQYKGKPDEAGKYLVNPLLPTKETLELGKKKFLTFCSPCHGNFGNGDSRLNGQFPNPPTLHSDKMRNWPDGNIFHVITEGQNIMPSYATQVSREERWAIVHYIRALQRSHNAKESDVQ